MMSTVSPLPWHGEPAAALVVLGVEPHQGADVIDAAAQFATRLGASVVCVWVDASHLTTERRENGTVITTPLDPDAVDDPGLPTQVEELHNRLAEILADPVTSWRLHYATGAPARILSDVAEELEAVAIMIGTRNKGFGHWAAEKIDGSVAARLAQHQHRPVILIPHPEAGGSRGLP